VASVVSNRAVRASCIRTCWGAHGRGQEEANPISW
jgi:hypothetical protein